MDRKSLEEIKASISIKDYLSTHRKTEFKKGTGEESICQCPNPAHEDKSPSCNVNNTKNTFNCFGCGVNGSIIDLIMLIDGLDVHAAITYLEEYSGNSVSSVVNVVNSVPANIDYIVKPLPVPKEARIYPGESVTVFNPKSGKTSSHWLPSAVHPYYNKDREIVQYTMRIEDHNGKVVLPLHWGKSGKYVGWILKKHPTENLPYGYELFNEDDGRPILVVEGEKAVDHFYDHFPDIANKVTCVSWMGGSNAVKKTDWSVFGARNFILWADNDDAGRKARTELLKLIKPIANGIDIVKEKDMPNVKDDIADTTDQEFVDKLLTEAVVYQTMREPWMDEIVRTNKGDPYHGSAKNVSLFIENHQMMMGVLRYDTTYSSVVLDYNPGFFREIEDKPFPRLMNDDDLLEILQWLETEKVFAAFITIKKCIVQVAKNHQHNSLGEWLHGLDWDGEKRIDKFYENYLHVEPCAYTDMVSRLLFMCLVSRGMDPGGKMDIYFILEGKGGVFKGELLRVLGGEYYKCGLPSHTGKEFFYHLMGLWLLEDDEMNLHNQTDSSRNKGWLTQQVDVQRRVHEGSISEVKRMFVTVATINKHGQKYLTDQDGNRRYCSVHVCPKEDQLIDYLGAAKIRDQLFAEAAHYFKLFLEDLSNGIPPEESEHCWFMNKQEEKLAAVYQDERTIDNVYVEPLLHALEESKQGPIHEHDFVNMCRRGMVKQEIFKHILEKNYAPKHGPKYEDALRIVGFKHIKRRRDVHGKLMTEHWVYEE